MTLIQPFRALRPAPSRAREVLAPPYDVLSTAEARTRARGRPWSFLHISKPEIDLDASVDPYDRTVYAKAGENLRRMIANGIVIRDDKPCYYVYRLTWRDRQQTGLAAVASIADYEANRIRKHELTTPLKEDDRVHQVEAVNAQTGPVMVAYPDARELDARCLGIAEQHHGRGRGVGEPEADARGRWRRARREGIAHRHLSGRAQRDPEQRPEVRAGAHVELRRVAQRELQGHL